MDAVLRLGVGLSVGAVVVLTTGCGNACEDDGFGGANCATDPIAIGSTGAQSMSGMGSESSSSSSQGPDESSSGTPDPSASSTTGGEETSSSTGEAGSQTWCTDADGDGFGSPDECQDVSDADEPPANAVTDDTDCDDTSDRTYPGAATEELADSCTKDADEDGWADVDPPAGVEAGTDCLDDDPSTFPGAAELDDASACMRDADDDGYGDSLPPAGAIAGTDCNDDDDQVPSASACLTWCVDADGDQYGNAEMCVIDPVAPDGYVGNDADCDDDNADAFPGAAPNDDDAACMLDVDDDDYGDSAPANAAITAGSDCDDLEVLVFDACFDCPAGTFFCNVDDNSSQCNETGTWGVEVDTCDFGCNDGIGICWNALDVDAGTCAERFGGVTQLTAIASGGDGNYTYAWTPDTFLFPDDAAMVFAFPPDPTTYQVEVSDGESNVATGDVTVHIVNQNWDLQADGCSTFVYADIFGAPAQPPNEAFFGGGDARCNLQNNSLPNAFVCPYEIDQARVAFDLEVNNNADNDGIGFVYGWQDASHFYLFSWKQTAEGAAWGTWEQGVTIKRIEAADPSDITGEDLGASYDTAHGTILATPGDFLTAGWDNRVLYRVTLDIAGDDATITIDNLDDGIQVATGTITDPVLGPGAVGSYDASQRSVCTDNWNSECL